MATTACESKRARHLLSLGSTVTTLSTHFICTHEADTVAIVDSVAKFLLDLQYFVCVCDGINNAFQVPAPYVHHEYL